MASVRVAAPAKINLHLRVYTRRSDGFHGLRSLFQAVSLADSLVIRSLKVQDTIRIEGDFDCRPEDTTIHKAVGAFRRATGIRTGLSIEVTKTIPAGAGLGGGSSDAAAVLRGLDALFGSSLGMDDLAALGAEIGSDVPFFFAGGCALVTGRGEQVEALASREDLVLLIHFPGFPVNSGEAYRILDELRPDDAAEADPSTELLSVSYGYDPSSWPFANSFEPWIGALHPEIASMKHRLLDEGARFSAMTGSGSCVFGVFPDAEAARRALELMPGDRGRSFLAFSLARPPALD